MKLYHGTNADIDAIDLNRGMLHKDFGKGFYLTSDQQYYFGTEKALCFLRKINVKAL